jgi:hypothetical protein
MTPAERQKRYRDRKRREREAAPERKREQRRTADRDRTTRAAVKVASDATLPAVPAMPGGLIEFCSGLVVTQGDQ